MVTSADSKDCDDAVKLFFLNIRFEDFRKLGVIEVVLEDLIIYLIDNYMHILEDDSVEMYEFRYFTILELMNILFTKGAFRVKILERLTNSQFLTVYIPQVYTPSKKPLFLELISVINKMTNSKLKKVGISMEEIDAYLIENNIVGFIWHLFTATYKRQNALFSACASFFNEVGANNHDDIIAIMVG